MQVVTSRPPYIHSRRTGFAVVVVYTTSGPIVFTRSLNLGDQVTERSTIASETFMT
jgi:hypothetical protein